MTTNNQQIVFHAGLGKTGSTFLQKHVFPRMSPGTFYCKPRGSMDKIFSLWAANTTPVLVSEENLMSVGRDEFKLLQNSDLFARPRTVFGCMKQRHNYEYVLEVLYNLFKSDEVLLFDYEQIRQTPAWVIGALKIISVVHSMGGKMKLTTKRMSVLSGTVPGT